jgi:hypothetical protein
MANILGPDYVYIGNRIFGSLQSAVQRCSFPVSTGSKFDCIITMTGSNWSLGTTDKRYLRALLSRRYAGSMNVVELEGNGGRWTGSFQSSGLGVLIETSNSGTCIVQLHNPYSNGATAGLTIDYEVVSGGTSGIPNTISTYTGSNYTSNNIF